MNEQISISGLIKELRDESTMLVKDEIALAKTEMREKATILGRNIGFLFGGALLGYSAVVVILIGLGSLVTRAFIEQNMEPAMAHFLGLIIVGGVFAGISAILVMKALHTLKEESLVPRKTIETLKGDKQWAANQLS